MIDEFVRVWDAYKGELAGRFKTDPPASYKALVVELVDLLNRHLDDYERPDPDRVVEINWGGYQGTVVFVIAATGYQPDRHWVTKVGYGSCSYCDALQSCRDEADYVQLALHLLQQLREV